MVALPKNDTTALPQGKNVMSENVVSKNRDRTGQDQTRQQK